MDSFSFSNQSQFHHNGDDNDQLQQEELQQEQIQQQEEQEHLDSDNDDIQQEQEQVHFSLQNYTLMPLHISHYNNNNNNIPLPQCISNFNIHPFTNSFPIKPLKERNQTDNSLVYASHRNYQVFQQAILLSLLNKYSSLVIKRERKRSNVTLPFFTIYAVYFTDVDHLDFDYYIQKRCSEIKQYDISNGINEKTATRRYKTNRITEVIHTLIDLLEMNGEELRISQTRYKEGIKQSDTVIGCQMNKKMMNEYEIKYYGKQMNEYLSQQIGESEMYFSKNTLTNYLDHLMSINSFH